VAGSTVTEHVINVDPVGIGSLLAVEKIIARTAVQSTPGVHPNG